MKPATRSKSVKHGRSNLPTTLPLNPKQQAGLQNRRISQKWLCRGVISAPLIIPTAWLSGRVAFGCTASRPGWREAGWSRARGEALFVLLTIRGPPLRLMCGHWFSINLTSKPSYLDSWVLWEKSPIMPIYDVIYSYDSFRFNTACKWALVLPLSQGWAGTGDGLRHPETVSHLWLLRNLLPALHSLNWEYGLNWNHAIFNASTYWIFNLQIIDCMDCNGFEQQGECVCQTSEVIPCEKR